MISILEGFNQRRLVLEGTLIGPWTTELRTAAKRREQTFATANSFSI